MMRKSSLKTALLVSAGVMLAATAWGNGSKAPELNVIEDQPAMLNVAANIGEPLPLTADYSLTDSGLLTFTDTDRSFGDLQRYTGKEIADLLKKYIGMKILGGEINSAEAVRENNTIILSSADSIETIFIKDNTVVIKTLDENGNATLHDSIYIADQLGNINCTIADKLEGKNQSSIMPRFEVMIDVSGSIKNYLGNVKAATISFLDAMPENAWCRVSVYNTDYRVLNQANGLDGWKTCQANNWNWRQVKADGGTDSTKALLSAFRGLNTPHPIVPAGSHTMSSLLIVSDGDGIAPADIPLLIKAKGDIPTYVYFEGTQKTTSYETWVDKYQTASQGQNVSSAFKTYTDSFLYARVVDPTACKIASLP